MDQPKAIAECPIESCPWTLDAESSRTGVFTPVPDTETLWADIRKHADDAIRKHLETHPLLEWVQEVTRLRTALDEATAENEPAEWRARIEATLLSIQSRLNEIPPART